MTNYSFLVRILDLQEKVLNRNIKANIERFNFVAEAIELLSDFKISSEAWETIPVEIRSLFNYFHADAVSTTINAIRLCLQGCETDAFALMRVVLENMTIFEYIFTKKLYQNAFLEIQKRSSREKPFSDKFSYETASKGLDIMDRRDQIRGKMSVLGSHSSPPRLSLSMVRRGDSYQPKVGMALDNSNVSSTLGELCSLTLFIIRVVNDFFSNNLVTTPNVFCEQVANLEKKYEALRISK